jgi:hypothetical protein
MASLNGMPRCWSASSLASRSFTNSDSTGTVMVTAPHRAIPFPVGLLSNIRVLGRPRRVADNDIIHLPAAELANRVKVGHHVQIIQGKHHERDADVLRAGDVKEMRGGKCLHQLRVQMRPWVNQRDGFGGGLSQNQNEFVQVFGLAA